MSTPMALMGMEPVEVTDGEVTAPSTWTWTPDVVDPGRLARTVKVTRQTSRKTNTSHTDYGEGQ